MTTARKARNLISADPAPDAGDWMPKESGKLPEVPASGLAGDETTNRRES